jgi:hypothetical protein
MLWLAARAYGFADWILFKFAALQLTRVQFSFPPRDKGVANRDSPKNPPAAEIRKPRMVGRRWVQSSKRWGLGNGELGAVK